MVNYAVFVTQACPYCSMNVLKSFTCFKFGHLSFNYCLFIIYFFIVALNCKGSLYSGYKSFIRSYNLQMFAPILRIVLHFLDCVACITRAFNLDIVHFIYFFSFVAHALGMLSKKPFLARGHEDLPYLSPIFIVLALEL